MSGTTVTKMRRAICPEMERILLTPQMAVALLEHNKSNRPVSDTHVQRIAGQIARGKWKFNGDTIKIADDGAVLDGQHRLWAVIEAKKDVETIIVRGIERDAFATMDTIRRMRSGADTLALEGVARYRNVISTTLTWLLRWQRGGIVAFRDPKNKIENSDIEQAFADHPDIVQAVERAMKLRRLGTPSVIAFIYYILANRNEAIAERMIATLEDPASVAINDPFFRLRSYFIADHHKRKEPLVTIALAIKAANAADKGKAIEILCWKTQGRKPEAFPTLEF